MRRIATLLLLCLVPIALQAATRTWTGTTNNLWSNPANWDTGVPAANDDLRFEGTPPFKSPFNDLPAGLVLRTITSSSGFTIGGNAVTLTNGLSSTGGTSISLPITLGATQEWLGTSGGTLALDGPVNLNGYHLSVRQTFPGVIVNFSNTISGTGSIGTVGSVWFTGHNTFSGTADANSISVFTNDGLGVADGTVANGTTARVLGLNGAAIGNENVTLTGQIICTGICSLAGPVTGGGTVHVASAGRFTMSGKITGTTITASGDGGGGVLTLTNPANTFTNVTIKGVTLRVGSTGALNVSSGLSMTAGGKLDMNNAGATTGTFTIDTDPSNTFAAGAQPLVVLSAGTPPHLDGTLTLTDSFVPAAPSYLIIDNRSSSPVPSFFDGLPEGGSFTFHGTTYTITYAGGDGNDVVLFVGGSPLPPTTTTISSSNNPANQGSSVTFTANVTSGTGAPQGTVTFRDNGVDIGTVALSGGTASISTSTLSAGTHSITATYNPTSAHAPSTSGALSQTIAATPLQVSITDYATVEGNSGTSPAIFVVTLSRTSSTQVVIDYTTQDATATQGIDYLPIAGSLIFDPGEGRKTLVVEVVGDTLPENDETFHVRITSSTAGVSFTKALGVGTIRNDDVSAGTTYEYARIGSRSLTLELSTPGGPGPFPVILWIHGREATLDPALREIGRGYAVASIDYRSSDEAKFPAQIADIKGAVRWLRAHASELHLDPLRIGAWGEDNGAWFASLLGTAQQAFDDPGHGNAGQSSRVSAVLAWAGQTDLNALKSDATAANCGTDPNAASSPESQFLGCAIPSCSANAATASPVSWVSSADASFFLVHGTSDCQVPSGQTTRFANALQSAGAEVQSKLIPGVVAPGHDPYWTTEVALRDADAFFDAELKGLKVPARRRSTRH